ncbi:sulfotransferase [Xanthobacter sp. KR7-65]|uniref:sulfotransferase family protein n=1 Tax=Xanthobacter sp. KR7-65 TaxID=3156612 RepID=UPI0032B5D7E2
MFAITPRVHFAVVGVQKAGTTALFHFLSQHPKIAVPDVKELHFFDDESRCWRRPDYRDYLRRFPKHRGRILGEATPSYIWWPQALERLHAYNPDVKVIAVFRDPVERAHAHWRMSRALGNDDLDFSTAIRAGRRRLDGIAAMDARRRYFSYVERGFYGAQVERLLGIFPREQVLMLRQDDLANAHHATLGRVFDFLGVERVPVQPGRIFEGKPAAPVSDADAIYLAETYAEDLATFTRHSRLDASCWTAAGAIASAGNTAAALAN